MFVSTQNKKKIKNTQETMFPFQNPTNFCLNDNHFGDLKENKISKNQTSSLCVVNNKLFQVQTNEIYLNCLFA
jgi:hypothetical protein